MKFSTDILGDMEANFKREERETEKALYSAMREASTGARKEWRAQIVQAGLGNKLTRSVRSRAYKNEGLSPAAVVWSKAYKIMRAFDKGTIIRAKKSRFLAIPTKNAPKKGMSMASGAFTAKISPANFPEHKYGKLNFVPAHGSRPAMLVVYNARRSHSRKHKGRYRVVKASDAAKRKGNAHTVVMFILIPQARIKKRLDIERVANRWLARFPSLVKEAKLKEEMKNGK